jgi:uncharacterized protein
LTEDERRAFAAVAAATGVPFDGFWLEAPADVLAARIAARRGDASDATVAVLDGQIRRDPGAIEWPRVDVGGGPGANFAAIARALGLGTG